MQKKYFTHAIWNEIVQPKYFVALSFFILSIRMLGYTKQFTVNMMFWDQWLIYTPLFQEQGLVEIFRYQHGPHRQGLGGVFIAIVASLSNWRGEWDAYLVGIAFIVAALLALWLKYRLIGHFDWFDVLIPILFLSLNQWETHTVVPNMSHSALPLVIVLIYAIALTLRNPLVQAVALLITNFFLLYTGFGVFAGLITPILFLYRAIFPERNGFTRNTRPIWFVSFILAMASLGSFFSDWIYLPAVDCIDIAQPKPYEYLIFAGLQVIQGFAIAPVASKLGLGIALILGLCILFAAILIAVQSLRQRNSMVIVFLITFSLLFVSATALGRICLGVTNQPLASKYSTLVLPLILGIYLWANKKGDRWYKSIGFTILILIILSFIPPFYRSPYTGAPQKFYDVKQTWKSCYLETADSSYCDQQAGFPIHPSSEAITPNLLYLERNQLNLFHNFFNDMRMKITYPINTNPITTDQVALLGIINPPEFERYEVQWGVGEVPDEWYWLSGPHLAPVVNDGVITTWDMSSMQAGIYTVRVTAYLQDGNKRAVKTQIIRQ
jgi:hypothetical protein